MTSRTRLSAWLVVGTLALPLPALAQEQTASKAPGPFGVGLILGAPTGVSAKARLGSTSSIDAAFGLGVGADVHFHGDYLFEGLPVLLQDEDSGITLDWYFGVGGRMLLVDDNDNNNRNDDDLELGPRAPLGLELYVSSVKNMEAFVEVAVGLDLVDETNITVDGGIGFRWFF